MNKNTTVKREITGVVVSLSSKDTVIIKVARVWRHPVYKKAIRRNIRVPADSGGMELHLGDTVRLVSTKPISKTKHYKVVGII